MQLLPPNLVPAARALIAAQGGNPLLLDNYGGLNADAVLALFFDEAEVRTSLTPPLLFPIGPSGQPASPATEALIQQLQPTVILKGRAGRVEIAPYGTSAGASSWWPIIILGGAIVAVGGWLIFGQRR